MTDRPSAADLRKTEDQETHPLRGPSAACSANGESEGVQVQPIADHTSTRSKRSTRTCAGSVNERATADERRLSWLYPDDEDLLELELVDDGDDAGLEARPLVADRATAGDDSR